jgi:hypothetical protein
MLSFSISYPVLIKNSHFTHTSSEEFEGERRPKDKVTLGITLVYTLTRPKTFTHDHVSVFDKYLHWPHLNIFKIMYKIYTPIYTTIDTYMHNTKNEPKHKFFQHGKLSYAPQSQEQPNEKPDLCKLVTIIVSRTGC